MASKPLPPAPPQGYNVAELAGYFQRQLLRLPGISVLAPTTMHSLLPPPYRTEQLLPFLMEGYDRVSLLIGSLDEKQWEKLGSARGLGKGDLRRGQQSYWDAAFGEGLVLTDGMLGMLNLKGKPRLSPQQLEGLRLRVRRRSWVLLPRESREEGESTFTPTASVLTLQDLDEEGVSLPEPDYAQRSSTLFPELPAQRKPTDLDPNSERLRRTIPLEGTKTVGELVARIGQSAGLALYVDARLEQLSVRPMMGSRRAGDILEALCRGLCGTVRRVSSKSTTVYILTDDLQGMGARMEGLLTAIQSVQRQLSEARTQERESYARLLHSETIRFDSDDPLQPDAAFLERVRQPQPYSMDFFGRGYQVPWDAVQGGLRKAIQARVAAFNAGTLKNNPKTEYGTTYNDITLTSIEFQELFELRALLPKLGERPCYFGGVSTNDFNTLPPVETLTIPAHAAARLALLAPKTREETLELMRAVVKLPLLTGVVLDASPELLQAAQSVTPTGFSIYAAASVLRDTASSEPRLLRINGEPSEWQALTSRQLDRVLERAKTPGIAGIVLRDLIPSEFLYREDYIIGQEVGFSLESRLSLLQSHHYDPIDLNVFGFSLFPVQLRPFTERAPSFLLFPRFKTTLQRDSNLAKPWNRLRHNEAEGFLSTLHQKLQAALPTEKIFLQEVSSVTRRGPVSVYEPMYYQPWTKATKLPYELSPSQEAPQEKPRSPQAPRWLCVDPADTKTLANLLPQLSQYNGCLFDLTAHSPEKALRLLEALRFADPKRPERRLGGQ